MDLSRLCIHTETVKSLSIREVANKFGNHGIPAVSVWRHTLEGMNTGLAGRMLRDHGLEIISLVRAGFFPSVNQNIRREAIDNNKQAIEEAAELGAPLLVLVCGSDPGQGLSVSRDQIAEALRVIVPFAEKSGVRLGIEPLHPMYSDTRSAINTLNQANDLAEEFNSPCLGVVVDVYHTWWDRDLKAEIERCGRLDKIFAYHVCDWKVPTEDMLLDRGLMGEGCIPVREITEWIEGAGFSGPVEVEIFSRKYWSMDQDEYIGLITDSFDKNV